MTYNLSVMFVKWMYLVLLASSLFASVVGDAVDSCRSNLSSVGPVLHRSRRHASGCRKNEWTCLDGSCIVLRIKCDGIVDCEDGSDESPTLCQKSLPQTGICILPEHPANGTYITDIPNAKPGDAYESVTINITCKQGFGVNGSNSVRCSDGLWTEIIPTCKITHCYLPTHHSVEYRCLVYEPFSSTRICKEYEPVDTVVLPVCRSPIYYSDSTDHRTNNGTSFDYMKCKDGNWNYIAKCKPECGTVNPAGMQLVIGGVSAKRAEIPWHAGIYTKTKKPYMQICGGSLVKKNIILSAAHCFWNDIVGKLPAAEYAVAVGKLYRPWIDPRDEAQQSDVKELHLSDHFQGSAATFQDDIAVVILKDTFEYTAYIRPVCIDFDIAFQEHQLKTGHKGKVAGWGLTAENGKPSQVLNVIDLPYVTTEQCISGSPPDFRAYITSDKMCAGYKDAGKALCKGDSGGGLAFPGWDKGKERYYLRGIVSTAPNNINLCNANTYTAFTLLLKHEHFVKYWMAKRVTPSGTGGAIQMNWNVVRTFFDRAASPAAPFHHLTVDRNSGLVYIGALNRIHQLTSDLERTQWTVTGPVMDNLELIDNANSVLVIDYNSSRLITCGNVFNGMCTVRNLFNISQEVRQVREPVVGNNNASSTVAFIAPGPPNPPTTRVLYVGTVFVPTEPDNELEGAVSSRSLEDARLFERDINIFSSVLVNNFVYGFSSEGFSYFLQTRVIEYNGKSYYSKLVRVCQNDTNYYSYTEIPISCTGKGSKNYAYSVVQAAFLGKAGPTLAAELGIRTQQDVLFAAFNQSEFINDNKPSNRSVLCVYSLKTIRRKFTQNIKRCFSDGIGRLVYGLPYFDTCKEKKEVPIDEDFCGINWNTPLDGQLPIEAVAAVEFDVGVTAMAATTTGNHTVVFAGTADGYLKKILVENSSSAFEYGDIDVDEGSVINKDLIFDTQLTHLYVMTEHRVSKVRVQECSEHKSCSTCLTDPYCGWRPFKNECSLRPDGQNTTQDAVMISYRSGRCPIITKVTPNQSQRTTPMTLIILIENLPAYEGPFECAFTAFGLTLSTNATRTSSEMSCDTPSTDTLPPVPVTENHFLARLSVRIAHGPDIVTTKFKFYD